MSKLPFESAKGRCGRLRATLSLPVHQERFFERLPRMKPKPVNFAICFAVIFPLQLRSQDPAPATADRATISGSLAVAEFVPPEPVPPKQVPVMRVEAATTVPSGNGKALTILRGEPSTLPDIPASLDPPPKVLRERTAEDLAREAYRRRHAIHLGATAYAHQSR